MARLLVAVAGGIIGAFFGMPQLGFMVGSIIGGLLFPPQQPSFDVEGPRLDDLKVSSSSYGQTLARSWGVVRLPGAVIWSTDFKETVHKESSGGGKGGGGGGGTSTTYSYSVSFAMSFGYGPATAIGRIWADGKLIHDPNSNVWTSADNAREYLYRSEDYLKDQADESEETYIEPTGSDEEIDTTYEYIMRQYMGTQDQLPDSLIESILGADNTPAFRGQVYIVFEDFELEDFGSRIPNISAEIIHNPEGTIDSNISIGQIVEEVCRSSGLTDSDFDAGDLAGALRGYYVARPTTPRAILQQLGEAFFFDAYESDGIVKFRRYGHAVDLAIPQDDMIAASDDKIGNPLKELNRPILELPYRVNVVFSDRAQDYQQNSQYAARINTHRQRDIHDIKYIELPMTLSASQARWIAEKTLYAAWAERDTYETKLSQKYLALDPTDVVHLQMDDGRTIRAHAGKAAIGADYSMELNLIGSDFEVFNESNIVGGEADGFVTQQMHIPVDGTVVLIDTPYLRDIDNVGDTKSFTYYGVYSDDPAFSGVIVHLSADGGTNWEIIGQARSTLTHGTVLSDESSAESLWATNLVDTIDVQLSDGVSDTLASVSRTEMLAGANAAIIGAAGRWEVVQFQTATPTGPKTYTLSNLLRGRRGTEWAINKHQVGDKFILLDPAKLLGFFMPIDSVGQNVELRAVPKGRSLSTQTGQMIHISGNDLRPYAPVLRRVTRTSEGLVLEWFRRARFGGSLQDGTGVVPLNESDELYSLYILPGPYTESFSPYEPSHYLRKFEYLSTNTVLYANADMQADGYDPDHEVLHFVVYQISGALQFGFPGTFAARPTEFHDG